MFTGGYIQSNAWAFNNFYFITYSTFKLDFDFIGSTHKGYVNQLYLHACSVRSPLQTLA